MLHARHAAELVPRKPLRPTHWLTTLGRQETDRMLTLETQLNPIPSEKKTCWDEKPWEFLSGWWFLTIMAYYGLLWIMDYESLWIIIIIMNYSD